VSSRFLLIDGYNLMHAAGMARVQYGPGDLQRCRDRLLRHLASHLSPAEITRTLVVFDAREPPPERPSRLVLHGVQVLFANPGGDADVVIQESLAEHSTPRRLTLVSSDHVLQRAARQHRADYVDSEDFFSTLSARRHRDASREGADPDEKPSSQLSAAEAEHWSQYFGDLSGLLSAEQHASEEPEPRPSRAPDAAPSADAGEAPVPAPAGHQRRRARRSSKPIQQKEGPKGLGDLDFWMQVFRGLPEAGELAQGPASLTGPNPDLEAWLDDPAEGHSRRKRKD